MRSAGSTAARARPRPRSASRGGRRFRHVVFPQAFRIALPPLGNTFIGLLKGATLISIIGVADMVYEANQINLDYFTPFEPFTAVAVILVVLVFAFSAMLAVLERALRLP